MSNLYIKNGTTWEEIPTIGGYTKDEVNTLISDKVTKSGDTMTGTLHGNINAEGTSHRVWGAVAN